MSENQLKVNFLQKNFMETIEQQVSQALAEDIGSGDVSSALLENSDAQASIWCRENAIICGRPWVEEVFRQLDQSVELCWQCSEGQQVDKNSRIVTLSGRVRSLLSGERSALNFMQTLSATATQCRALVLALDGYPVKLLDTRKTLPGLRLAQKYAIRCGGGENHRFGLYDAYLLKENHLAASSSLSAAVEQARKQNNQLPIQVEITRVDQLEEAIAAKVDMVLLDNFSEAELKQAVDIAAGRVCLEASGSIDLDNIRRIAATGVDRISSGSMTKHLRSVDFSMLLEDSSIDHQFTARSPQR